MFNTKMRTLLICVGCLALALDQLNTYKLTYMDVLAMLSISALFVCIIFFYDKLFSYIWGCITAIMILIPVFMALIKQNLNYTAMIFDSIVAVSILVLCGYKLLKMIKNK